MAEAQKRWPLVGLCERTNAFEGYVSGVLNMLRAL